MNRSLIEIQSGDQKGEPSHPVRTEEPSGKKERKTPFSEKTQPMKRHRLSFLEPFPTVHSQRL